MRKTRAPILQALTYPKNGKLKQSASYGKPLFGTTAGYAIAFIEASRGKAYLAVNAAMV